MLATGETSEEYTLDCASVVSLCVFAMQLPMPWTSHHIEELTRVLEACVGVPTELLGMPTKVEALKLRAAAALAYLLQQIRKQGPCNCSYMAMHTTT